MFVLTYYDNNAYQTYMLGRGHPHGMVDKSKLGKLQTSNIIN